MRAPKKAASITKQEGVPMPLITLDGRFRARVETFRTAATSGLAVAVEPSSDPAFPLPRRPRPILPFCSHRALMRMMPTRSWMPSPSRSLRSRPSSGSLWSTWHWCLSPMASSTAVTTTMSRSATGSRFRGTRVLALRRRDQHQDPGQGRA